MTPRSGYLFFNCIYPSQGLPASQSFSPLASYATTPLSLGSIALVSCRERNLKGSRINKKERKPNKAATRLQWTCWFRGGVGPQRALCERGGAPYSCGVLTQSHSNTHYIHTHGSITQKQLDESILYKSLKITNVSISRSLSLMKNSSWSELNL